MQFESCRRRFLALASSAVAGATFFDVAPIFAAPKNDPYGGWPVGVQSYSLRNFNTLEVIRHIHGMGLHFVEFYSGHLSLEANDDQINETKALLAKADISLNAHGVNSFTNDHTANKRIFEFARRAGIRNITANPNSDAFDSLDQLVDEYGIRICIHNHGPGDRYDRIDDVAQAVKGRHRLIGACVDTGHFIRSREDPVQAVRDLGPRVFAIHIKDQAERKKNTHNVVIGSGHLDVVELFKAIRAVNFPADGSISLEYEANPDNPIDDIKQCLVAAREAIARAAT